MRLVVGCKPFILDKVVWMTLEARVRFGVVELTGAIRTIETEGL
jgi:hypothetical protein